MTLHYLTCIYSFLAVSNVFILVALYTERKLAMVSLKAIHIILISSVCHNGWSHCHKNVKIHCAHSTQYHLGLGTILLWVASSEGFNLEGEFDSLHFKKLDVFGRACKCELSISTFTELAEGKLSELINSSGILLMLRESSVKKLVERRTPQRASTFSTERHLNVNYLPSSDCLKLLWCMTCSGSFFYSLVQWSWTVICCQSYDLSLFCIDLSNHDHLISTCDCCERPSEFACVDIFCPVIEVKDCKCLMHMLKVSIFRSKLVNVYEYT